MMMGSVIQWLYLWLIAVPFLGDQHLSDWRASHRAVVFWFR